MARRPRRKDDDPDATISLNVRGARPYEEEGLVRVIFDTKVTSAFGGDAQHMAEYSATALGTWQFDGPFLEQGSFDANAVVDALYPYLRSVLQQLMALSEMGLPPLPPLAVLRRSEAAEEPSEAPRRPIITVEPTGEGGWDVKGLSATRRIGTQAEAIAVARRELMSRGGGELRIKGRDGRIRDQSTIGSSHPKQARLR